MRNIKTIAAVAAAVGLATVGQSATHDLETLNQSSRGWVGTGDKVLIGGAILHNGTRVIIRALGPTIASFVGGTLKNPMVDVFDQQGHLIVEQRSYLENSPADLALLQQQGKVPHSPEEPAVIVNVTEGKYTAVVRGENGETGIALVEFYLVR